MAAREASARLDHPAQQFFRAAIGGGDGGEVAFEFDGDVVPAEERADEVAAGTGELDEKSAFGGEVQRRRLAHGILGTHGKIVSKLSHRRRGIAHETHE